MKRTQLYLEDDVWNALRIRSRKERTTVSELVRRAVREHYLIAGEDRRAALMGIVGMWKDRREMRDPVAYIRSLRQDRRSKPFRSPK